MDSEQLADKLARWIRDKVVTAGCRGVVVGISGGLDSSVLAVLCQRAFPQNTLGVIMPCYSQPEDKAHALALADKFSIQTTEVGLDNIYDACLQSLPDYRSDPALEHLSKANLKVRMRMLILYCIANRLGYMVAGASNRSEIAMGYFTKYGDGGVDIMPLGNLVKAQVRELASFLGVPRPIIEKPPSAGLWEGQTDEEELGFTYAEIDGYLLTGEASGGVKEELKSRMAANAHKRSVPPIPDF